MQDLRRTSRRSGKIKWWVLAAVVFAGNGVAFGQEGMGPYPEGKSPAEVAAAAAQSVAAAERAAEAKKHQEERDALRLETRKALEAERAKREADVEVLRDRIDTLNVDAEAA